MHGFQNHYAQLLSLRRRSASQKICLRRLKVKVTFEGQMIKWSSIELVRAITCTFIYGFQNNFAQLLSPTSKKFKGQLGLGLFACPSIYFCPTPPPPPPKKKKKKKSFIFGIFVQKNSLTLVLPLHPLPSPQKIK